MKLMFALTVATAISGVEIEKKVMLLFCFSVFGADWGSLPLFFRSAYSQSAHQRQESKPMKVCAMERIKSTIEREGRRPLYG